MSVDQQEDQRPPPSPTEEHQVHYPNAFQEVFQGYRVDGGWGSSNAHVHYDPHMMQK